jgi:hypothetical protein
MGKFFKRLKESRRIKKEVFDYYKIEKTEKETLLLGDFADKDFCNWLSFIHRGIQLAMNKKLIDGKAIENYVNLTFYLSGQRVDIAIIKDGCKSPHELLQEAKIKLKEAADA